MAGVTPTANSLATADLVRGLGAARIWTTLARQDILTRYRGSILGPLWLTLSTAVLVAGIGIVYGSLFNLDPQTYLPFLAVGLVVWQLILSLASEGCMTFVAASGIMQQTALPLSLHAFRVVTRNVLAFGHNLVVLLIVLVVFRVSFNAGILLMPLGLLVIAVNGFAFAILFGMVSARFRDLPPIVASVFQLLFFVTPILWSPDQVSDRLAFLQFNPVFALIDTVRAPLLGQWPAASSWPIAIGLTVVLGAVTFAMFSRLRARVAYWL